MHECAETEVLAGVAPPKVGKENPISFSILRYLPHEDSVLVASSNEGDASSNAGHGLELALG
jgi:hypothetical protein